MSDPSRENRAKLAVLSPALLLSVLRGEVETDVRELPDDAEIVGVNYDPMRAAFLIRIASVSFVPLRDGESTPEMEFFLRRWQTKEREGAMLWSGDAQKQLEGVIMTQRPPIIQPLDRTEDKK